MSKNIKAQHCQKADFLTKIITSKVFLVFNKVDRILTTVFIPSTKPISIMSNKHLIKVSSTFQWTYLLSCVNSG